METKPWRSHKAPPDERGGNRYVLPNARHFDRAPVIIIADHALGLPVFVRFPSSTPTHGRRALMILRHDRLRSLAVRLTLPGAPAKYRANSACNQSRIKERPFSALPGLAPLSRHMLECVMQFLP